MKITGDKTKVILELENEDEIKSVWMALCVNTDVINEHAGSEDTRYEANDDIMYQMFDEYDDFLVDIEIGKRDGLFVFNEEY
jgi:hypothetical protein